MAKTKNGGPLPPPYPPAAAELEAINRALRDAAIKQVQDGANERFKAVCALAHFETALRFEEFTSDNVTELMDDWSRQTGEVYDTRDKRVVGAIMKRGGLEGLAYKTNRVEDSRKLTCHCSPSTIWVSRIYQNGNSPARPAAPPPAPEGAGFARQPSLFEEDNHA